MPPSLAGSAFLRSALMLNPWLFNEWYMVEGAKPMLSAIFLAGMVGFFWIILQMAFARSVFVVCIVVTRQSHQLALAGFWWWVVVRCRRRHRPGFC